MRNLNFRTESYAPKFRVAVGFPIMTLAGLVLLPNLTILLKQ